MLSDEDLFWRQNVWAGKSQGSTWTSDVCEGLFFPGVGDLRYEGERLPPVSWKTEILNISLGSEIRQDNHAGLALPSLERKREPQWSAVASPSLSCHAPHISIAAYLTPQ